MGKNREKYFRCPKCGILITKAKMLRNSDDLGMCFCQYKTNNILIPYDEISKKEYEARLNEKSD